MNITERVADFVIETDFDSLPGEVVHDAKRIFLDSMGCAIAGMNTDKGRYSIDLARKLQGPGEATIIGSGEKVSCASASFANGELINALDMDCILYPGHVSPYVIPACLAFAESTNATGKALILALAIGHELSYRLGRSLTWQRRYDKEKGEFVEADVHGYSACILGGCAGVGKILGFDKGRLTNVMGLGGHFAPVQSMVKWIKSPPCAMHKYLSAGWIGMAEVIAAWLGQVGYTGDTTVLDGEYGFWRQIGSVKWNTETLLEALGKEWHLGLTEYKPYPCCRYLHGALDSFKKIVEENDLLPEDIEEVKVLLDPLVDRPVWQNRELKSHIDTQFSVAYAFAAIAYRLPGYCDWGDPEIFSRADIKKFMNKVSLGSHPGFMKVLLDTGGKLSEVEVKASGKTFRDERRWCKGDPWPEEARMSDEELKEKFERNAMSVLGEAKAKKAIELISALDDLGHISPVLENLTT